VHGIRTVDVADALPLDEAIQPLIAAMADVSSSRTSPGSNVPS